MPRFDYEGRLISQIDPVVVWTTFSYRPADRLPAFKFSRRLGSDHVDGLGRGWQPDPHDRQPRQPYPVCLDADDRLVETIDALTQSTTQPTTPTAMFASITDQAGSYDVSTMTGRSNGGYHGRTDHVSRWSMIWSATSSPRPDATVTYDVSPTTRLNRLSSPTDALGQVSTNATRRAISCGPPICCAPWNWV